MNIRRKRSALFVLFHPDVWGGAAFFFQAPKATPLKGHSEQALNAQHSSVALNSFNGRPFGYRGDNNEGRFETMSKVGDRIDPVILPVTSSTDPIAGPMPAAPGSLLVDSSGTSIGPMPQSSSSSMVVSGASQAADMQLATNMETLSPVVVQGGALRTWSFPTPELERVLVSLTTEGRHIMANIKVCQGPDNAPQIIDVFIDKGYLRPFKTVIETPGGGSSIFIRNTGPIEYPIQATVGAETTYGNTYCIDNSAGLVTVSRSVTEMETPDKLQGSNSVRSYDINQSVSSCLLAMRTDGRPLNARIELIQGPNSNKEVMELYTENGIERPFYTVISTPGARNTIRVVNTATMEFPLYIGVEPFVIENEEF